EPTGAPTAKPLFIVIRRGCSQFLQEEGHRHVLSNIHISSILLLSTCPMDGGRSYIRRWTVRKVMESTSRLLERIGGDFSRCLPLPILILPTVRAGTSSMSMGEVIQSGSGLYRSLSLRSKPPAKPFR